MYRSAKTNVTQVELTCSLPEKKPEIEMAQEENTQDWFDFSLVLDQIGQFGWWQKKIFLWLCIVPVLNGLATLAYSFVAFVPK